MIVVCRPEDSLTWYDKLWKNTVDLFRSMDIPVRRSSAARAIADLKVKSVDVEAWSPRQQKFRGRAAEPRRRTGGRLRTSSTARTGKYLAHTLNNTVAPRGAC